MVLKINDLVLVKQENFGAVQCDFWRDQQNDILMTRDQIGSALEYADPQKAIATIHERNKDRLDKFSVFLKLRGTDGKLYDTYVYTARGVYEICRFSRQPKADAFMDWAWDVIESIRKTGSYTKPTKFPWADDMNKALRQNAKLTKNLSKTASIRLNASTLRQVQENTGHNYSELISILEADAEAQEQKLAQATIRAEQKRIQAEAKAESKEAKALASTPMGQAQQALEWIRQEYAKQGDKLAHIHEDWLLVRSDLWKMWAGKRKLNLTMICRELHSQGIVEKHSESGRERYGIGKRIDGKAYTFIWLKRDKLDWPKRLEVV